MAHVHSPAGPTVDREKLALLCIPSPLQVTKFWGASVVQHVLHPLQEEVNVA